MNNAEKYLGESKLTNDYRGFYFCDIEKKAYKRRIGKILKHTEEEIVFITSEKNLDTRIYIINVLKRFDDMVYVFEWTDKIFPNSAKAIRYYKAATK
jgi:hypothetical protein